MILDVKNKTVLVIGMARSGIALAKVLRTLGAKVIINDVKPEHEIEGLEQLPREGYVWALGQKADALVPEADLIVVSPSVPLDLPYARIAKEEGKEVIAELELAYRLCKAPCIAITGTNGKTTTTTLTGKLFEDAGRGHYVVGNIGVPYILNALEAKPEDVMVTEVSSYQLEGIVDFHPHIAALLNITEDHMNRHQTMDNYIAAKKRVCMNQTAADFAVLNFEDQTVRNLAKSIKSRPIFFSSARELPEGVFLRDGAIVFKFGALEQEICMAEQVRIRGVHNLENAMAAVAMGMLSGISAASIADTLQTFPGVEHRLEFAGEVAGVCFINDSKGTNPDSTIKAIQTMDRPTVLILGGYDKAGSFAPVFEAFTEHIRHIILIGATARRLEAQAKESGYDRYSVVESSFYDGVMAAYHAAQSGDNVLLSPACASFDMFRDFEERGRVFKQIVAGIKE